MRASSSRFNRPRSFTLIELLLVVFILAAVAATAISVVDHEDQQFRFQETQRRLAAIRTAVVGRPQQVLHGQPQVSGFVADMGRLPKDLQELLDPKAEIGTDPDLKPYGVSAEFGLGAGWRGPYLQVMPDLSGERRYRDGWGSAGSGRNSGWEVDSTGPDFFVQSYGADSAPGATTGGVYEVDYPPAGTPLVKETDYLVDLSKRFVTVYFSNTSPIATASTTAAVRLLFPHEGEISLTGPGHVETDPRQVDVPPDATNYPVRFQFKVADPVPWGLRALVVCDLSGSPSISLWGAQVPTQAKQVLLLPRVEVPADFDFHWSVP